MLNTGAHLVALPGGVGVVVGVYVTCATECGLLQGVVLGSIRVEACGAPLKCMATQEPCLVMTISGLTDGNDNL